jgi:hypothetical protein
VAAAPASSRRCRLRRNAITPTFVHRGAPAEGAPGRRPR